MAPFKIAVWIDSIEKIRIVLEVALVEPRNGVMAESLGPHFIWIAKHSEICYRRN